MAEFSIIRDYCQGIGPQHHSTRIDIGDDAAVFEPPNDQDIAISTDTMVEGVHFLEGTPASHLAHKILSVNCSDMAAMGALPKYATMALTIPSVNTEWLAEFSSGLKAQAEHYQVQLIGGDTTNGNLTLSCTIIGLLDKSKVLSRGNAKLGDDVYVSGCVGDAALGLANLQGKIALEKSLETQVQMAHYRPQARVELGLGLLNIANACIDVSDGLVADLTHICHQSQLAMEINVDAIPVSAAYKSVFDVNSKQQMDFALYGGDDYELAFTVKPERRGEVKDLSKALGLPLSKIGSVTRSTGSSVCLRQGDNVLPAAKNLGFEHFTD